jgi:flagellar basal-body rod modification protein FlgD
MFQPNILLSTAGSPTGLPAASAGLPPLDSQGFLTLLITQLQHQDPLSPADPGDTVQQLAALTQVSTLQEISDLLKQKSGTGSIGDPAAWLGRSALVPSSKALPLQDGSYAGEVLIDSPTDLDIAFKDGSGAIVHTEHHAVAVEGSVTFNWDGKVDGVAVKGPLSVTATGSAGSTPSVAVWTTVASIRRPATSNTLIETPLGAFTQEEVIDLK